MKRDMEHLATLARMGLASAAQKNELAAQSMAVIRIVCRIACHDGRIRFSDVDDVIQNAIIKAFAYISSWDASKSTWETYISRIASSAVGDQRRDYERDDKIQSVAIKQMQDKGEI